MKSFLKLSKFLKPYWRWVVLAPVLMIVEVAMDLMQPRLIQKIVDEGIANLDMPLVIQTGLLMIGLAVIGALGGMSNGVFTARAVQAFGADLRDGLFRRVQALSFGNLEKLGTGQLVTRLTNDVLQVQDAIQMMLRVMVRAPLLMLGSLVMAVITSPQLAFLPLVLLPVELAFSVWIIQRATSLYTAVQQQLDSLNGVMQENLAGVRVVKAFVRGKYERDRFGVINARLMERMMSATRLVAVTQPFMMLSINLGVVGVLWFGGLHVNQGSMQVGQIIAFVNYLMLTLSSLMTVSMLVIQLARAVASAERIQEVLESQPDVQDRVGALRDFAPHGRVVFENVTFSYDQNGNEPVLKNINLVAEAGQIVALLGVTGSGKSSLVSLIPRFFDVTAGRVTIDGVDVRDVEQETLRRRVSMVLQEPILFSGTIRDNIRFGRPDASEAEIVAAATAAQAHEFILSIPEGYDARLGQRGVNLSGGQKQRISIARALLMDPAVLILDDSTSSVDVETSGKIHAAINELEGRSTRFIIAQRVSTLLEADKIVVLEDGCLVAEGTHSELLASSPIYREIYESQLGTGDTQNE